MTTISNLKKTHRGNTNKNMRGNTVQRRARRQFLVTKFGDGTTVECHLRLSHACKLSAAILTVDTVSVDCYPIPRVDGGTYAQDNIRPACIKCNCRQGGIMTSIRRAKLKKAA